MKADGRETDLPEDRAQRLVFLGLAREIDPPCAEPEPGSGMTAAMLDPVHFGGVKLR